MNTRNSAINWFEIPVRDMDRAQAFYERMLGKSLRRELMGSSCMLAVIPYEQPGVGGALMAGSEAPQPATQGALVYLNAEPSLDAALERAVAAGGTITMPRVELPDGMGSFAHVLDTEGNRIGLHAMN
jgi:uncharacterized protein